MNLIKSVKIKNFFSVKNEVSINFAASQYTIENHPDRLFHVGNEYYNKLIAFYGPNASGKTTILKALVLVAYLLSNKSEKFPFAIKNIYSDDAISFIEVEFIFEGQIFRYKVEFECEKDRIIGISNEILEVLERGEKKETKKTLINRNKKVFNDLKGNSLGNIIIGNVPNTKSLLIETLTRTDDYKKIIKFFNAIVKATNIIGPFDVRMALGGEDELILSLMFEPSIYTEDVEILKESLIHDKKKFWNFLYRILPAIGLDIQAVISDVKIKNEFPRLEAKINQFTTLHNINPEKALDFKLESNGTRMIFKILFNIFYAYEKKTILVIDELDSILHPMVVPFINLLAIKNDIQLIYTSQNIYNMKYLYSDELFIIEKDSQHNTTVKKMDEYGHEGYENFVILYENNLLGGLPQIKAVQLEIDDGIL